MGRFDRYMLSQLMAIFGLSSVVLVLIYWINRAVRLFDWLIASGESAATFLEFTALTLPNVIRIVLPVSAFVATLYTANRLASESELVVVQANGFSPYRLARPVFVFGLIVALFMGILVHFIVPLSHSRLAERQVQVAENITGRLLVEGRFVHPSDGMTLYIRAITGSGELKDVYLHDNREPNRQVTYTSSEARLVRTEEGPRLIMIDGMAQVFRSADRGLAITRFNDFAIDVSTLLDPSANAGPDRPHHKEAPTLALLSGDRAVAEAYGTNIRRMAHEAHNRIIQPIIALTLPLVGFACLLVGGFSRFGVWSQIFAAIGLVMILYIAQTTVLDAAFMLLPGGWPVLYIPQAVGLLVALAILWLAANPKVLRPRRPKVAP